MLKSPIPDEEPRQTRVKLGLIVALNELFAKSPDGLREIVRAVREG